MPPSEVAPRPTLCVFTPRRAPKARDQRSTRLDVRGDYLFVNVVSHAFILNWDNVCTECPVSRRKLIQIIDG